MRIFVIGATGFVGGNIARSFAAAGHTVEGLARTPASATILLGEGIEPARADFDGRRKDVLSAAGRADAVVFAAQMPPAAEADAVADLLVSLEGTGKAFLFTSGSGVLLQRTNGAWSPDSYTEDDGFTVEPLAGTRMAVEQVVRDGPRRGIRAMVIRPGMIWGPNDHGHISMIYESVARTGSACYVGQGLNVYSNTHIDDVAKLFAAALRDGRAGSLYHAVSGETPTRWIAEAVAADLGVATRSLTPEEAVDVWGEFGALIISASSRIRAPRSRLELGWTPDHSDMLSTVGEPRLRRLGRHDMDS